MILKRVNPFDNVSEHLLNLREQVCILHEVGRVGEGAIKGELAGGEVEGNGRDLQIGRGGEVAGAGGFQESLRELHCGHKDGLGTGLRLRAH